MLTLLAFVVALGVLIAIHEYGHYRVAVACGVKVLRFSVGFGKPVLRWRSPRSGTEFVLSALPLGGYVRMLDEREAPVERSERHLAFNTQPLRARAAIVAAGPVANLLLAVVLYAVVAWAGVEEPQPVIASPVAGSLADRAGLRSGQWVLQAAQEGEEPEAVVSFDDLRWHLTQSALEQQDLLLWVADAPQAAARPVRLPLSQLSAADADTELMRKIGLMAPWSAPLVGEVLPGGAAESAGLRPGDKVLSLNGRTVEDAPQLRSRIREAVNDQGQSRPQHWWLERAGQRLELVVTPKPEQIDGVWVGRVGAFIGAPPSMTLVSEDLFGGLWKGLRKTWEVSVLSLKMMAKMVIGEASFRNLSGPLTIADYAGKSASLGLVSYLTFLALISVSLGVLNLLPLPVLDGGHLMYYLWEALTGKPVSDVWMERLQRGGVAIMVALMSVAVFNDIARLLG
jgi:regulator of sigma E protease